MTEHAHVEEHFAGSNKLFISIWGWLVALTLVEIFLAYAVERTGMDLLDGGRQILEVGAKILQFRHKGFFSCEILAQLERVDDFRARKQAIVGRYDEALQDQRGLSLLQRHPTETFPFFYVVRVLDGCRDAMMAHLRSRGVGTGVHYTPNHLQPAFSAFRTPLPVTEQVYEEILTLPLFYEMDEDQVGQVIEGVRGFFL